VKETTDPTPTVRQRLAYGYDPAGNRVFEQIDDGVTAWSHDALNRLVAQAGGGVLQVVGTVNEPATVTIQGKAATVSAANQFTGGLAVVPGTNVFTIRATDPSGNAATATYEVDVTDAQKTFTYDANGNLTTDGARTFEWDARNQLVAWTENSHRVEYSYDGFGRRTYAKELSGTATVAEKRFVWCGSSPCEERQGPSWGSGKQFFSHGFSELGSQDFYVVDHLGSVREVTDPSGALVQRLAYDPWGRETLVFGTSVTPFTYAEQMDFGGGVALAVHRAYSPEFGRWLSQDPMGLDDGPNMYAYVASNPVLWTDPLGLWKTGGPANRNTNTIVCDGSGNVTTQTNNTGTPQQTACLGKCFVTHERSHKEDVEVAWPGICKNKAAGTQVLYSNRDEQKWSEKKACRFELRCLRAALSASCGGSCDQIIRDRIKQMQTWCSQW
jgi:RHS repeat-associated protein